MRPAVRAAGAIVLAGILVAGAARADAGLYR
jgi:hypothetical protein